MNKGTWLGSLLAALAVFVWGFLFWGLGVINPFDTGLDSVKAQEALKSLVPGDGVYLVPEMSGSSPQEVESWVGLRRQGPLATVIVRQAGAEPVNPVEFALGFLHNFVTALLLALLLGKALSALPTYGSRVGFILLAGAAATFWSHVSDPIWMAHPWRFHLMSMAYDLVAWAIMGAILARFVKSK